MSFLTKNVCIIVTQDTKNIDALYETRHFGVNVNKSVNKIWFSGSSVVYSVAV